MKTAILTAGLVVFCVVGGAFAGVGYEQRRQSRFTMQASGDGALYKIDRQTGQVWMVYRGRTAMLGEQGDNPKALSSMRSQMLVADRRRK